MTRERRSKPGWAERLDSRLALKLALAAAWAWTLAATWDLWQARDLPPTLPVLAGLRSVQVDFGWIVALSVALALSGRALAVGLHLAVLGAAMAFDQTRMQPQFFSLGLLWLGTLPSEGARTVARAHLSATWLWAGLHKLLSLEYLTVSAPWLWSSTFPGAPERWTTPFGVGAAVTELALGLGVFLARARPGVGVAACAMHLFILAALVRTGWNESVWPWNAALAVAALVLITPWREPTLASVRRTHATVRVAALAILASPALYYVGAIETSLAHCLYAANRREAFVLQPDGGVEPLEIRLAIWERLGVGLPHERRLFHAAFAAVARPGERLGIRDPRRWHGAPGPDDRTVQAARE